MPWSHGPVERCMGAESHTGMVRDSLNRDLSQIERYRGREIVNRRRRRMDHEI